MSAGLPKGKIAAVIAVLVVVLCIAGYLAHLNGDSFDFSDTETKIVVSGSMDGEPRNYEISTIPVSSLIFINKVNGDDFYSSLKVGDVLTFNYTSPVSKEHMVVTHRITDIKESLGVYTYTLKGDSLADDPTNGSSQVVTSDSGDIIGKVTGVSSWLGLLVVFLSTWTGKICLIAIPCVLLIVYELWNILNVLRTKRTDKREESIR